MLIKSPSVVNRPPTFTIPALYTSGHLIEFHSAFLRVRGQLDKTIVPQNLLFNLLQELFTLTCREAQEKLGECTIIMDNASYHKRLTSEKDRLGYWTSLKAAQVLEAWDKKEVGQFFRN